MGETAAGTRHALGRRCAGLARRYGDALRSAEVGDAHRVVEDALAAGVSPTAVQSLVIAPAMERIGELWAAGAITVADEHLATAISHGALVRLFEVLRTQAPGSRETVVLAAPESQHHVLGLRMVADVLEGAGFEVLYLGPDVPTGSLRSFVAGHRPAAVGLAYGMTTHVAGLADAIRAVHDGHERTRVFLGGRAVPDAFVRMGYPTVDSTLDLMLVLERILASEFEPPLAELAAYQSSTARFDGPRAASTIDDVMAERLAHVTAQTADRARTYVREAAAMQDLAFRDPLTGMANRRAFDDRLREVLTGPDRGGRGALVMIDVDEFKTINDTHGHDAGDQMLVAVAEAIGSSVRRRDLAARVGGDEFAIVLPWADMTTAADTGERIRQAVRRACVRPAATVSIGVAPLRGDPRAAQLAADQALYRAKSEGRDRVTGMAREQPSESEED